MSSLTGICSPPQGEATMKEKKTVATTLLVVGGVLVFGSLIADVIGIGGAAGFGAKQVLGAITGILVAGMGFVVSSRV
jgi:hypothetical protein